MSDCLRPEGDKEARESLAFSIFLGQISDNSADLFSYSPAPYFELNRPSFCKNSIGYQKRRPAEIYNKKKSLKQNE